MRPLILTAKKEDAQKKLPPALEAETMSGKYLCTIRADKTVIFNPGFEYSTDELKQIAGIEKNFFTIYNSILEKDKLIEILNEEKEEAIKRMVHTINPIISRQ